MDIAEQIYRAMEDFRIGRFEYPEWERAPEGWQFDRHIGERATLVELGEQQIAQLEEKARTNPRFLPCLQAPMTIYGAAIVPVELPSWLMAF